MVRPRQGWGGVHVCRKLRVFPNQSSSKRWLRSWFCLPAGLGGGALEAGGAVTRSVAGGMEGQGLMPCKGGGWMGTLGTLDMPDAASGLAGVCSG
jgi:hypothetical protein